MNTKASLLVLLAFALIANAKEPTTKPEPKVYTNKATVGMTEEEAIACYDPELYHAEVADKKGALDRVVRILTNSRGGAVGDGFNVIEGTKPELFRTLKISKKTGKVFYVSKGSK